MYANWDCSFSEHTAVMPLLHVLGWGLYPSGRLIKGDLKIQRNIEERPGIKDSSHSPACPLCPDVHVKKEMHAAVRLEK